MPKTKDEASEAGRTLLQTIEQNSADNAKLADKLNGVAGAAIDTIVKVMQAADTPNESKLKAAQTLLKARQDVTDRILKRDLWKESVILSQRQRVRTEPIIVHPLQDIAGIDIICDDKPSFTKQRDLFIIALERFCLVCCWHGFTSNVL